MRMRGVPRCTAESDSARKMPEACEKNHLMCQRNVYKMDSR